MKRDISIGGQGFEYLIKNNCFYVDKTGFIKEWWDSKDVATLITRPRRFGKTINMDMLNCFFSNKYAGRGDLFEGLDIWKYDEFRELQGTYPVIFLSFASVKENTLEKAKEQIKKQIEDLYNKFADITNEYDYVENEISFYNKVSVNMDDVTAGYSLNMLSSMLEKRYGKKTIILLDEYDTPLQEAYIGGYWDEMVSFIRSLFNSTFKTNPSMERSILTGVTRVSKESIFSDLNNLKVVTTTSDEYSTCFGFTEKETFDALDEMGYSETDKNNVKTWYDGFTFGKTTDIYNPWSITNYMDTGKLKAHWANTSSNGLVSNLIRSGNKNVKMSFEDLLDGKAIVTEIDEEIVFNQLSKNKNAIWSLLLASGYLKVVSVTNPAIEKAGELGETDPPVYTMTLTNLEVKSMFQSLIKGWFEEDDNYGDFVKSMFAGNVDDMNYYMNKVALSTFSSFDTGNRPSDDAEPERFYHGVVLGLLVSQASDYVVLSNRESGRGRYDVVMKPRNINDITKKSVIMEFKVLDTIKGEKTLSETADDALKQIEDKKYEESLIYEGISSDRILKYGFAFQGKEVLIKKK